MEKIQCDKINKKIRFMVNYVWNGITMTDVEGFLKNFSDEKEIGLVLLDMLIFYSQEQEEHIAENLIRLLKRDIWVHEIENASNMDSMEISKNMSRAFSDMCFVPLEDSNPSDSSNALSTIYNKIKGFPKLPKFITTEEIPLAIAMKKRYIVIYDDLIGTGGQITKYWGEKEWFAWKITLDRLAKANPDVKFYYLAFGGFHSSIQNLKEKFPDLHIIVSELFTQDYDVYNEDNEYWEFNQNDKNKILEYLIRKKDEMKLTNSHSLNLPVLFQHGRASNTALPLYWCEKNNWKALYKR